MTSVRIKPAGGRDFAMHRERYEQLVAALQESGFDAEIEVLETRTAPFSPDIIIHIGEVGATAKGVADLIGLLRRVLRGLRRPPSGEPRRAVIYGPDGEVISAVDLPDD